MYVCLLLYVVVWFLFCFFLIVLFILNSLFMEGCVGWGGEGGCLLMAWGEGWILPMGDAGKMEN